MANLRTDAPLCRQIVAAFLDFLTSVEPAPGVDREGLEVAKDCLRQVFSLDDQLSGGERPDPHLLVNLFSAQGVTEQSDPAGGHLHKLPTVSAQNSVGAGPSNASNFEDNGDRSTSCDPGLSRDELFGQFFAALERIHFFKRFESGDDDQALLDRATSVFHNAVKEMESSGCKTFDTANLAEAIKTLGNKTMQSKLYSDAIECYTCAIALQENSAVYYCNRAAAYTQINKYNEAIRDCCSAIEIDPNYSKAYSRLGLAYYAQGNYSDAISKGFKKALELDPNNDAVKENIKVAEQKLRENERRSNQRWESFGPNREFRNYFTGGSGHGAGASVSFDSGTLPANLASMFMNLAPNVVHAQNGEADHNHDGGTTPSMSFDPSVLPADLASMFMNMAGGASQGQHFPEQPQEGSNGPSVTIDGNTSINFSDQVPEEVMGTLRSMMGMFPGTPPQGDQPGNGSR